MKLRLSFFAFIVLIATCVTAHTPKHKEKTITMTAEKDSLLRHVVLFKFKTATPEDKIKEIEEAFGELQNKISQIQSFEWGLNNSPENLNKEFTHCFFLTFKSEQDRSIYLPHPDHQAFGALLTPYLEDVLVIDYWTS